MATAGETAAKVCALSSLCNLIDCASEPDRTHFAFLRNRRQSQGREDSHVFKREKVKKKVVVETSEDWLASVALPQPQQCAAETR